MYLGNIVEILPKPGHKPGHPYTAALTAATLSPDPRRRLKPKVLFKDGEEMRISPAGCVFQNRCLLAFERCLKDRPALSERPGGHMVACHLDDISPMEAPWAGEKDEGGADGGSVGKEGDPRPPS